MARRTGNFPARMSIAVNFENNADYVYVADTGNNRIQKFDSRGNWILTMGSTTAGSAPGDSTTRRESPQIIPGIIYMRLIQAITGYRNST